MKTPEEIVEAVINEMSESDAAAARAYLRAGDLVSIDLNNAAGEWQYAVVVDGTDFWVCAYDDEESAVALAKAWNHVATDIGVEPQQCKDIDTDKILQFLAQHQGEWSTHGRGYSMPTVQDAMPPNTPEKLQHAKMRQLHKRGLVGGCTCGCRGDWEITDEGLAFIGVPRTTRYSGY